MLRTHRFVQVPGWTAGKLLHVVCRKPQLLLPPIVTAPPKGNILADCTRHNPSCPQEVMCTCRDSPATLLFVHVQDERLFGETELVFPLSSVIIQSFDCTLKRQTTVSTTTKE